MKYCTTTLIAHEASCDGWAPGRLHEFLGELVTAAPIDFDPKEGF